ncbi:SPOR domain-containing protein [Thalassotalea euphylliae]|uniref:SPOR domain-containing protein n=1 Tax=Thalassotalea euphylliae TaxID=1655234 RepID=UPI0036349363
MTALATQVQTNHTTQESENITAISVNARVDYILKFSKHLVAVIDDVGLGYGSTSGSYLDSLPEDANAALVNVSARLNDVQVRARINEQLFPNEPFDPEVSLTKSVAEQYERNVGTIAIVIEQAQHLSLQVMHELTLLVELAKKLQRDIQVVLLGNVELGKVISQNYTLFSKKLSMISMSKGQLLHANASLFKAPKKAFSFTPFNIAILVLLGLLVVTFVSLYSLYQRDSFGFAKLPGEPVSIEQEIDSAKQPDELITELDQTNAGSQDILSALSAVPIEPTRNASVEDILAAITVAHAPTEVTVASSRDQSANNLPIEEANLPKIDSVEPAKLTEAVQVEQAPILETNQLDNVNRYTFDGIYEGVVIQYTALKQESGVSDLSIAVKFAERYLITDFKYYTRSINGEPFVVITSLVFNDRNQAKEAMSLLPEPLRNSGIWLKSVQTVQTEIQASL